MNDRMDKFIFQCLLYIPCGRFRRRAEAELRDHMQTLRQVMTEAEVLEHMGDPERLRVEYKTAWERSLLARLKELGRCLVTWAVGWAIMLVTHCRLLFVFDSNSPLWLYVPLFSTLAVGACFLGLGFRRSPSPTRKIRVGLSLYGTFISMLFIWLEAVDDHVTFWQKFTESAGLWFIVLAVCFLLGKAVGGRIERRRELA